MRKIVIFIISLLLMMSAFETVQGQIPDEVLKSYKTYNKALKQNDYEAANKAAYQAWKTSERLLGDNKTTGDLALNFAILYPKFVTNKEHKIRSKAYLRSIELGRYHGKSSADVTLERHLEYLIYMSKSSVVKANRFTKLSETMSFSEMETALDVLKRRGSWYEAVMEGIRTTHFKNRKDFTSAIISGNKGFNLFEKLVAEEETEQKYQLIFDLGYSYFKLGKNIEAALILQRNFHQVEDKSIPKKISRMSERYWKLSWVEIYKSGEIDNAKSKGLCACIEPIVSLSTPEPILRIPPIMPVKAERSGEAIIIFDLKSDGSTTNIRLAAYTEKHFGQTAIKAAEKFIYTPLVDSHDVSKRQNLPVYMRFTLKNGNDDVIVGKPLKTIIPVDEYQSKLNESADIIIFGHRIKRRVEF